MSALIALSMRTQCMAHVGFAAILGIPFATAPISAQTYPTKAIKLVVPFGPGGPTDVSARIVSQVVQSGLGQTS